MEFLLIGFGALCLGGFSIFLWVAETAPPEQNSSSEVTQSSISLEEESSSLAIPIEPRRDVKIDRVIGKIIKSKETFQPAGAPLTKELLRVPEEAQNSAAATGGRANPTIEEVNSETRITAPSILSFQESGGKEVIERGFYLSDEQTVKSDFSGGKQVIETRYSDSGKGVIEQIGNGTGGNGIEGNPGSGGFNDINLSGGAADNEIKRLLPLFPSPGGASADQAGAISGSGSAEVALGANNALPRTSGGNGENEFLRTSSLQPSGVSEVAATLDGSSGRGGLNDPNSSLGGNSSNGIEQTGSDSNSGGTANEANRVESQGSGNGHGESVAGTSEDGSGLNRQGSSSGGDASESLDRPRSPDSAGPPQGAGSPDLVTRPFNPINPVATTAGSGIGGGSASGSSPVSSSTPPSPNSGIVEVQTLPPASIPSASAPANPSGAGNILEPGLPFVPPIVPIPPVATGAAGGIGSASVPVGLPTAPVTGFPAATGTPTSLAVGNGGANGVPSSAGGPAIAPIPPAVAGGAPSHGSASGTIGSSPTTSPYPPSNGSPPPATNSYTPPNPSGSATPEGGNSTGGSSSGAAPPSLIPIAPIGGVAGAGGGAGGGVPAPIPAALPSPGTGSDTQEDNHDKELPGQCIVWVVQPGQSIASIAASVGTNPATIMEINKVSAIQPGQTIRIPVMTIVPCCE